MYAYLPCKKVLYIDTFLTLNFNAEKNIDKKLWNKITYTLMKKTFNHNVYALYWKNVCPFWQSYFFIFVGFSTILQFCFPLQERNVVLHLTYVFLLSLEEKCSLTRSERSDKYLIHSFELEMSIIDLCWML